ncbi:MAG: hypothetical protein H6Q31_3382, partial [Bacteroidetes bacterium]|nr:hypothetical protein [Bacteroidota bacterium]
MSGERPMIVATELRIFRDDGEGIVACKGEKRDVGHRVRDTELRHAALPRAEEIPGAPEGEVRLRDREPVSGPDHRGEPL